MLWRTEEPGGSHRLPNVSAPSWSWASVTGPVYYHEGVEAAMESGPSPEFCVEGVYFDSEGAPSVIIGDGCVLQLQIFFDWTGKWTVQPLSGPGDMNLAVSWDCGTIHKAMLDAKDQRGLCFLVFGIRSSGKGPFGLVLKLESEGAYSRMGFISGYRGERRRQSWGSDGWHYEESQSSDLGTGNEDEQGGWEAWIRGRLASPKASVKIV
jgi:hypothetical protein